MVDDVRPGAEAPDTRPAKGKFFRPDQLSAIVHCHLRWDFVWQRPQQIFSRLAARHPVLFVEEPLWAQGGPRLELSEPHPNVVRAVPLLPRGDELGVDAQCEILLPLVHRALREHPLLAGRFDTPVQWFYSPMTVPCFLGRFGAVSVAYDCMDELANFRFAPPDIGRREQLLLSRADVVFTGGYRLFQSKSRHHRNVHFYGCGVDVEHYGKARLAQTVVPPEVAGLPRPIFGYFGVIDERLDYDLLSQLARSFPHASVVMAGPFAKVDPDTLPRAPNIHWLGQRPYSALPALVKSFDVCLMPFAMNEATQYINPTKTLEYMAAGKPIVSTAVPDVVRNFTPIVRVARSHEEFIGETRRVQSDPGEDLIARGLQCASRASWDAVVAAMCAHILETVPGAVQRAA
jgi:glycosyltransferase involved in cell wall biosynthesis